MPQKRSFLQALKADELNQTSFLQNKATAVIGEYLSSKSIPYDLVDVNRDGKVNVVSDFQGGKVPGPRVVLNGHVDVSPVGDGSGWSRDPWSGDIADGRLHGRGVVDMKSGTASLIIAYAFLYERRRLLSGSVALCAVADEETGGKWGTKYLIEHDKQRWGGDLMLCAEPGGLETIRFAEKGTLRLTCTVETKGALGPYLHLTKGAIRTASAFINEVIKSVESLPVDLPVEMERHLEKPEVKRAIDQAMGPGTTTIIARPTVNVGTIKGGLKVNMIPETCIFELDIRMPVGMREDTILELISTIIPQYEPASITIQKQAAASNRFNYSVIDHPIVDHLKDNAKSLQPNAEAPIPIPSMGGSDFPHCTKLIIVPEKKILSLGLDVLKKSCVDYLLQDKNNVLTISHPKCSFFRRNIAARRSLAKDVALGVASLDIDHSAAKHDLGISLTGIATTSYVSPAICEVDNQAKAVDITVLSDVGVDPGVDRLYTIKTVGEVLEHYVKVVEISNKGLMSKAYPYHVLDRYSFLAYPKRDSVPPLQAYGIPEAGTIIPVPLRYDGNPASD
ncbi:Saccharopine dehydrogenase [Fusarium napiforme]|uniref:Saccharopine dehydrogenase n=1 Tax=Fusarium napiforme TaxID=42672 RepID=A0A8H5K902_9HYPO|nr:Saccharopine dehydrogenase [Fusarium napiforme]